MISGSGSFGTINILSLCQFSCFSSSSLMIFFQRSPFIVSNKYNLLFLNMASALFRGSDTYFKQLIPKDCTQKILKVFVKNKFIEKPNIILSLFYHGGALYHLQTINQNRMEWIDVSVQEFVTYDRRASKNLCKILVILYNERMNKYSDWILPIRCFIFTILGSPS